MVEQEIKMENIYLSNRSDRMEFSDENLFTTITYIDNCKHSELHRVLNVTIL